MIPHPEGGHYVEVYKNKDVSHIYYLLEKGQYSHWHRIKKNETIHFYTGSPLRIYTSKNGEEYEINEIGSKIKKEKFNEPIILTCKGIDSKSGKFPTQIIGKYTSSNNLAVLSGPSFASEVLDDKPTAVIIASKNKKVSEVFSEMFHNKFCVVINTFLNS